MIESMQSMYVPLFVAAMATLLIATFVADRIGSLGFPLPRSDHRLGCLDGLRGFLALSVLIHHFGVWIGITQFDGSWAEPSANLITQLGAGAVGLFFMTTGMVFYPRVLEGFAATPWRSFFITRVFRIVPVVATSIAIVTVIITSRTSARPDLAYIAAAVQWLTSWGEPPLLGYPDSGRMNAFVLWSLWYEWIFYLCVLPACAGLMDIVRVRKLPTWLVPVLVIATGIGGRIALGSALKGTDIFRYLPLFGVGMMSYEIRNRQWISDFLTRRVVALVAAFLLFGAMMATRNPYGIGLPAFALFFVCVGCGNTFFSVLSNRGALVLGECSFGLYALHGIVLDSAFTSIIPRHMEGDGWGLALILPVLAVAALLFSVGSYLVVERPSIIAGKSIARRLDRRARRFKHSELEVAP